MKKLELAIIAVDSFRTRAYLDVLLKNNFTLSSAILLDKDRPEPPPRETSMFDSSQSPEKLLKKMGCEFESFSNHDINSREIVDAVRNLKEEVIIFSGSGGQLLRNNILNTGKKFLHVHPGIVPQYRGSTTVYYSILLEETAGASAIFLNKQIDCGEILCSRTYAPPQDRSSIDYDYDPGIRADLLVRCLKEAFENGGFRSEPQEKGENRPFYIMHPVLRHITILRGYQP